ncbi:MAG: HpcH/HpaI aldolase/citrate lyase family protein [Fimbriimonadales bacterium]
MNNRLRGLVSSGRPAFGLWSMLSDPTIVEMIADAGFDYVGVDLEHSSLEIQEARNHLRAAGARGLGHIVRMSTHDPSSIVRVLDMGAEGILVTHVKDAADASAIIAAARYTPIGHRGTARTIPAGDFGSQELSMRTLTKWFNEQVVVGLMVEDASAVDDIDAIVKIHGLDMIQIGATDLAASLGYLGEVDHPEVGAAMDKVRVACLGANLALAFTVGHPSYSMTSSDLVEKGYRMLICGTDMAIMMWALTETARRVKV